jgi:hypothetical protein
VGTSYERFGLDQADELAEFLTGEDWRFHSGGPEEREAVLARVAAGFCDNETTQTYWVVVDGRTTSRCAVSCAAAATPRSPTTETPGQPPTAQSTTQSATPSSEKTGKPDQLQNPTGPTNPPLVKRISKPRSATRVSDPDRCHRAPPKTSEGGWRSAERAWVWSRRLQAPARAALRQPPKPERESDPLEKNSEPLSDTHAQRRQPAARVLALHATEQRHRHPGTGATERMAERDRAAVEVDLVHVES